MYAYVSPPPPRRPRVAPPPPRRALRAAVHPSPVAVRSLPGAARSSPGRCMELSRPPRIALGRRAELHGDELHGAVERLAPNDDVVARVVAEEARLHPEEAQHDGGRHVRGGAGGGEHEPDGAGEQRGHGAERGGAAVALAVEEPRAGELGGEAAVVAGHLGDAVVGERGDAVAVEDPPRGGRVVRDEGVRHVLPAQAEQREVAARVARQPRRDVVDLPLHRHPQVALGAVLGHLRRRHVPFLPGSPACRRRHSPPPLLPLPLPPRSRLTMCSRPTNLISSRASPAADDAMLVD
ncbi:hypothetical protein PVAP13_5KG358700 [Panicum virgatum]|uniref:Uncharacterized protein n=1 Tax=Panicum virgatum TaxID=38727 RepID=A0A8T0SMB3_PANVG|nr:hypothetical protein PVAP13_5KG358700 [Panicum virgatum]